MGNRGRVTSQHSRWLALGICFVAMAGCAVPTALIEHRHWELNDSIRQTNNEQLLLNLVRLRYDETPFFLQVSSITTQFSLQQNVGATGNLPEGGPNTLGLSGGIAYTESPAITWSLPDSREYYGRLLAPMSATQLTTLAETGWDPGLVFRVGVRKMNRLRNQEYRVGEGIFVPDSYEQFREVFQLVRDLRKDNLADFSYGVKSQMGAGKIPLDKLNTRAIPEGLQYGLQFMTRDDPNVFEPLKLFKPIFLRLAKQSDADPRAKRLRQLLDLDPQKYSFGIVDSADSAVDMLRSESGKPSQAFDPDAQFAELVLDNRSMMEVLYFASTYVQIPDDEVSHVHANSGTPPHADWLRILVSSGEPFDAWRKVKYRGYWYYIALNDVKSRSSFALMDALFASVVGTVPGAKPFLSLPIK